MILHDDLLDTSRSSIQQVFRENNLGQGELR